MKTLSVLTFTLLSSVAAHAESYMSCTKTGESDAPAFVAAPSKIGYEEAGDVTLLENDKYVKARLQIRNGGPRRVLISRQIQKDGVFVRLNYNFDHKDCDSEETGRATFSTTLGRNGQHLLPTVATYTCECGVD